jgi:hypothetical protein
MDAFVKLSQEERKIFFEGASAPLNLAPLMVEKDFWVCLDRPWDSVNCRNCRT